MRQRQHKQMRSGLSAAVEAAKSGARVVVVCSKAVAKQTHAALAGMDGGARESDTWRFGKGTIEVRT